MQDLTITAGALIISVGFWGSFIVDLQGGTLRSNIGSYLGFYSKGVRIRGTLEEIDPRNEVPSKRATSRVQKGLPYRVSPKP